MFITPTGLWESIAVPSEMHCGSPFPPALLGGQGQLLCLTSDAHEALRLHALPSHPIEFPVQLQHCPSPVPLLQNIRYGEQKMTRDSISWQFVKGDLDEAKG